MKNNKKKLYKYGKHSPANWCLCPLESERTGPKAATGLPHELSVLWKTTQACADGNTLSSFLTLQNHLIPGSPWIADPYFASV